MFRNVATIEYRETARATVVRVGQATEARGAEAEARKQRFAAERALDSVLADSFPASDPPSWTLGITRAQPEVPASSDQTVAPQDRRGGLVGEDVIDVSKSATDGRLLKGLVSVVSAAGIALLVPFIILLIGMPIVLAVRGVAEAASWLLALIFG
jgi:hypothetical protein